MDFPVWLDWLIVVSSLTAVALASWVAAALLLPIAHARTRVVAAMVLGFYYHAAAFIGLTFGAAFNVAAAVAVGLLPGALASIALVRRPHLRSLLRRDHASLLAHTDTMFRGPAAIVTLAVITVATMQFVHAVLSPPLAWDSLTYHLPRAAFWAQTNSLQDGFDAPMAWEYFRTFWPIGDSLSSWSFLLTWTDLWIPVVWGGVWVCGIAASYGLARELGARRDYAWIASLAAWTLPALARHAFVAHIENIMLMLIVAGLALLVAAEREREPALLMIGLAGLAEACLVKPSALPYAAAGALAFFFVAATRTRDRPLMTALAPIPALAISLPVFIRNASLYGSPMYPFRLELGGKVLFEASPEFAYILAHETKKTAWDYVERLFLDGPYGGYITHINFGALAIVLLLLGVVGCVRLLGRGPSRFTMTLFVAFALFALYTFVSTYTWTGNNTGRHVATVPLFLAAAAATLRWAWTRDVLGVVTLGNLVFFLPFNWYKSDREMLWELKEEIFGTLLILTLLLWVGARFRTARTSAAVGALLVVGGAIFVPELEAERAELRYDVYQSAGKSRTYSNIRLGGRSGISFGSAAIWEHLDTPGRNHRIAVTAGWDRRGINWALYPLFGRKLQNTLLYVPPTRSGRVISPRNRTQYREALDYEAWKARLAMRRIDYVVSYYPTTYEMRWIVDHPEDFEVVKRAGRRNSNLLARPLFIHNTRR